MTGLTKTKTRPKDKAENDQRQHARLVTRNPKGDWYNPYQLIRQYWYYIPLVNLLVDALCFAPTAAGLDRMLNFIAVQDTLLLGVVVGTMTNVNFEEMQDHWGRAAGSWGNERGEFPAWSFCSKDPYALGRRHCRKIREKSDMYVANNWRWDAVVDVFGEAVVLGVITLSTSLFICVTVYILGFTNTAFNGPEGDGATVHEDMMAAYWMPWLAVPVLAALVFFVTGTVYTFVAFFQLMQIKVPSRRQEAFDRDYGDAERDMFGILGAGGAYTWGYNAEGGVYFILLFGTAMVGTLLCQSIGMACKYHKYYQLDHEKKVRQDADKGAAKDAKKLLDKFTDNGCFTITFAELRDSGLTLASLSSLEVSDRIDVLSKIGVKPVGMCVKLAQAMDASAAAPVTTLRVIRV